MAEDLSFSINLNGEDKVIKTMGELKKALKEADFQALQLAEKFGDADARVTKLRAEAGKLRNNIQDAASMNKAFAQDSSFPTIAKSIQGLASGFTAVQGAMGLVGLQGEDVEKALLKVQSALALSQGLGDLIEAKDTFKELSGVIQGTTAFKKIDTLATKAATVVQGLFKTSVDATSNSFKFLKGAIAATGIGLLVVLIGELVSAFQNWQNAAEETKKKQEELNKVVSNAAKVQLEGEIKSLENQQLVETARLKSKGATEEELYKLEQSYRKSKGEAQLRYWNQVNVTDKEGAEKSKEEIAKINAEGDAAYYNNVASQNKKLEEQRKENTEKKKKEHEEYLKDLEDARQKELEIEKKSREDVLALDEDINKVKQEIARVGLSEKDSAILQVQQELDDNLKLYANNLDAKQKAYLLYDAKIKLINDNAKVETKKTEAETTKDYYANLTAKAHVQIGTITGEQKIKEKAATDDINLEKAKKEAQIGLASDTLNILGGLVDKNSVAGKAIAISQAIINTYQGASKALAQTGVMGPIAAAATIAAGMINVKKIISTKVPSSKGGGDVGGGGGGVSISASAPIQPQMPEAQMTQLNQTSINAIGNQAIRAYVVETDVTTNQQRINAIKQRARFG